MKVVKQIEVFKLQSVGYGRETKRCLLSEHFVIVETQIEMFGFVFFIIGDKQLTFPMTFLL